VGHGIDRQPDEAVNARADHDRHHQQDEEALRNRETNQPVNHKNSSLRDALGPKCAPGESVQCPCSPISPFSSCVLSVKPPLLTMRSPGLSPLMTRWYPPDAPPSSTSRASKCPFSPSLGTKTTVRSLMRWTASSGMTSSFPADFCCPPATA